MCSWWPASYALGPAAAAQAENADFGAVFQVHRNIASEETGRGA